MPYVSCVRCVLLIAINGILVIEFQSTLLFHRNPNLMFYNDYVENIFKIIYILL